MTSNSRYLSLDETLHIVEGFLAKKFTNRIGDPLWEDLLQEGQISAWKDYQEGGKDITLICTRAKFRVLTLIQSQSNVSRDKSKSTRQWTGHLPMDKPSKYAVGDQTRERIRDYIDGYRRLHGHDPTFGEVTKSLGLTGPQLRTHLNRLYLFSGPLFEGTYSLDQFLQDSGNDTDIPVIDVLSFKKFSGAFEDGLVLWLDMVNQLREAVEDPVIRSWVYLYVFRNVPQGDIAKQFEVPRHTVHLAVKKILNQFRDEMFPELAEKA